MANARFGAVMAVLLEQGNFAGGATLVAQDGADAASNGAALVEAWAGSDFTGASRWVLSLPQNEDDFLGSGRHEDVPVISRVR